MRFCKFVPLDTFSIIQSLRKTSGTSIIIPLAHCLDPENNLFPSTDSQKGRGSPAAFCLEASPHLRASPWHCPIINDSTPVATLVLPLEVGQTLSGTLSCLPSLSLTLLLGKDHIYKAIWWDQEYLTTS